MEKPKTDTKPILNHDRDAPIEVLRREFSSIGNGKIGLFKDEATGVATLTFDHPERKNALSGAMMAQFSDIISELEGWKQVCDASRYLQHISLSLNRFLLLFQLYCISFARDYGVLLTLIIGAQ